MNVNLSLGILSFIIWSAFSTWYYVTFIRQFNEPEKPAKELEIGGSILSTESTESLAFSVVSKEEITPLNLSKNVLFEKNSIALVAPQEFEKFSDSLIGQWNNSQIQVNMVGYACDLGTEEYNLTLSKRRAEAVSKMLSSSKIEILTISYKGESEPVVPNTTESNRLQNRRVNLQFTAK